MTCVRSDDFCLVVDGALYDDMITSFEYEAGDHYILEADQYDDGRYVLSEVVSTTRAAGTEEEISVDRHRVQCDDGHPGYCKVVNDAPFRGEIVGFQPRARLRLPPARREVRHVSRRYDRITPCSGLRLSVAGDAGTYSE